MKLVISTNSICSAVYAERDGRGEENRTRTCFEGIQGSLEGCSVVPFLATLILSTKRGYNADGWLDDLRLVSRIS